MPRKLFHWPRGLRPSVGLLGLLVAVAALGNGIREINQQRDAYRDVADRLSFTDWLVDVVHGRREATFVQVTTKNR